MTVIESGSHVTAADLNILPPTSRVRAGGYQFYKKPNGKWMQAGYPHNNWESRQVSNHGDATVEFVPYPVESKSSIIENYDAWERRFVTAVRHGANQHGVRNHVLTDAFTQIGLSDRAINNRFDGETAPLRPGYRGVGPTPLLHSPVETVVMYDDGRVFKKERDGYFHQAAPIRGRAVNLDYNLTWTLIRWGADGPLPDMSFSIEDERRLDAEEETRLIRTKQAAWRVGMQLKSQHGWCSTLESILADGGVTPGDANGGTLNPHQQAARDVGTIFLYQGVRDTLSWALLRRTDTSRTAGRTEQVIGTYIRNGVDRAYQIFRPGGQWYGATFAPTNVAQFLSTLIEYQGLTFETNGGVYRIGRGDQPIELIDRSRRNYYDPAPRATARGRFRHTDFISTAGSVTLLHVPGLFS